MKKTEHHVSVNGLVEYFKTSNRTILSYRTGVHRRQIVRYFNDGVKLRIKTADRIGKYAGVHPSEIFPDYYD